jgi:hypothetical protein
MSAGWWVGRTELQDIAARLEAGNNQPPGGLRFPVFVPAAVGVIQELWASGMARACRCHCRPACHFPRHNTVMTTPLSFCYFAGAGGFWRGYNVAPAKGLQLFEVEYPTAVDDPTTLLYPDLPHDEFGRVTAYIPGASSIDEE